VESGRRGGLAKQANARSAKPSLANLANLANQAVEVEVKDKDKGNGGGSSDSSTTTVILNFIKGCKTLGYSLDESKAREILGSGIDSAWLSGPSNFLEYTDQQIKSEYPDKPSAEKRFLFLAALTWDNLREDFPAWRDKQNRTTTAKAERCRKDAARAAVPETCGHCGAVLAPDNRACPSCNWIPFFNEESEKYEFQEAPDLKAMFAQQVKKVGIPLDNQSRGGT
jgi:hypothetical protein